MYRDIDAAELAGRLGTDNEPLVLDVREPDEVAEWAIPGSLNVPLRELGHSDSRSSRATARSWRCARRGAARRWQPTLLAHEGFAGREPSRRHGGVGLGLRLGRRRSGRRPCRPGAAARARVACRTSSAARGDEAFVIDPSIDDRCLLRDRGRTRLADRSRVRHPSARRPPLGRSHAGRPGARPCCTSIRPTRSTSRSRRCTTATASRSATVIAMSVAALRTPGPYRRLDDLLRRGSGRVDRRHAVRRRCRPTRPRRTGRGVRAQSLPLAARARPDAARRRAGAARSLRRRGPT